MLALILATLLIQDAPAFGIILSDDPEPPAEEVVQRPKPDLPAHALTDPFGYERSQCSPYLRKDEPLEHCQVRVRSDLLAVLGDALPSSLRPTAGLENCRPGNAENNFQIECRPRNMTLPALPNLQDRTCENRPERLPDGRIVIQTDCRSTGPEQPKKERGLVLFSNN